MNFLFDPNVAYVLLVGGMLLAVLAIFSPGTGVLEIGALFMLVLAGVTIASFTVSWWALGVLVVGVIPFLLAMRRSRQYVFLIIALAALVVGSIFLIIDPATGLPAVHPLLAVVVSLLVGGFILIAGRRTLEAMLLPVRSLQVLIGKTGEARTDVFAEGTVYVDGEEWSGRSATFIPAGSPVRVVAREGLILLVEPAS
jgi:membrane-bound ClpP family serine protease